MKNQLFLLALISLTPACNTPSTASHQHTRPTPSEGVLLVQHLVEKVIPNERFDLCYFDPRSSAQKSASEIIRLIKQSGGHGIFLVIGSENAMRNKEVAELVLPTFCPNQLSGSKIALIGSQAAQIEMNSLVKSTGAEFLFIELPETK